MLHDPGSYSEPLVLDRIDLTEIERNTLKRLASEIAEIATLPVHREKERLWTRLNDLDSERPMVWINEIPWHEMNIDDELTLQCTNDWARELETTLRRTIYQWRHFPCDMVVPEYLECPLAIHSTDFGIHEETDIAVTDSENDIVSRHFHVQIAELADVDKIQMPQVVHHQETTDLMYETMTGLFGDIIPVRKVGQTHIWFTPWDYLIRWTGVQEAMMALVTDPDMINAAVERLVDAWMVELDQFIEQNLLALDNRNIRVGSGGYGYISDLPGQPYDPEYVKPHNMWGCSNAQIFSEVSPEMHWEFAMRHDMRWLDRWGVTYYGCCEPLQNKIHLLKRIPNLRKVSVSPWNDIEKILPALGTDYVASVKPSPAVFASGVFDRESARQAIATALESGAGDSHIELIMKDISTVKYRPQQLWEWGALAMEMVEGC